MKDESSFALRQANAPHGSISEAVMTEGKGTLAWFSVARRLADVFFRHVASSNADLETTAIGLGTAGDAPCPVWVWYPSHGD